MSGMLQNFSDQYAVALQRYLVHREEAALQQAYVLGRKALAEKIGLVEMVSVHQKALADSLMLSLKDTKRHSLIKAGDEFFRECVGPFEMTLRGFQESMAKLQQMNEILEKRVMERTESMRRTAETLRALFQASPLAVIELDSNGHVLMWNPAAERLFGWKQQEVLGLPNPIIPAEQQKDALFLRGRALQGESFAMLETTRQRKNGSLIPVSFSLAPLYDSEGKALGVVVVIADITERKQAEEDLRHKTQELRELNQNLEQRVQERTAELARANEMLRQLSIRLLSAQEEERKKIAGEIHDTLGSCLSGVKFRIQTVLAQIGKDSNVTTEAINSVLPVIQEGIEECRRMQQHLRPSILDDLGLLAALSWFCRRYQTIYTGIKVEVEQTLEERDIPDSLKIVIFRVMQEGMNNVAKHSKADLVHLSLRKVDGRIEVVLDDNGQGFNLKKVLGSDSTKRGLGLTSMRERTELSGGSFAVESVEGKGTTVRASWPFWKRGQS